MSDISSDKDYYTSYYDRMGSNSYTGESVKHTSRMLVFCEWLRAELKPGAKVLDIGCGDAIFAELMPEFEWYGIDMNVERALPRFNASRGEKGPLFKGTYYDTITIYHEPRDKSPEAPTVLIEHDLMKPPYPWPEKYFDAIVCSEVLEHVWDLRIVHKEAKRLLKRDGLYVISTPNFNWLQNHLEHFQRIMQDTHNHWAWEHIRHYGYDTHKKFLNEVGFVIEKHAGGDGHYDPITANFCRVIRDRLREQGTEVQEEVLHKWCGEAVPHYAHTIILSCRKA